jgi:hypothetical protein
MNKKNEFRNLVSTKQIQTDTQQANNGQCGCGCVSQATGAVTKPVDDSAPATKGKAKKGATSSCCSGES